MVGGGRCRDPDRLYRGRHRPDRAAVADTAADKQRHANALATVDGKVHGRPPSFCTGCPERPIFAAMKLVERELGAPLPTLSREDKQRAIRLLDERGAFILRRAVEDVADAMGVSRITVYNYLNALHR